MPVVFREKSVGQHGANIFYKEFSVLTNSNYKTYCLGSFCFVQKPPYPVTIAEFQLIWKNTYTNKKYACVKLYFDPENEEEDEDDYAEEFGRDEVIEANRQVVIECCELPYWECSPKLWSKDIGQPAFSDVCKEYIKRLIKKEHVITSAREDMDVKIISYPQYCRYMACMKMIKIGVPMTFKVFVARGGLQLDNINTIILFSRGKFTKLRIDDFSLTRNITVPVFKGRPRKKKHKELMLLKKRNQKKLLREVKKWKLESRKKRKYNKRTHKDTTTQDSHSSANSAASRIINKYKKKNEKTELAAKKETVVVSLETTKKKYKYHYSKKKTRNPNDGRLMKNKFKKAALLNNIGEENDVAGEEIVEDMEISNMKTDNTKKEDNQKDDANETEDNKKEDVNIEENIKKDVKRKEYTKKKDENKKICSNGKALINNNKETNKLENSVSEKIIELDPKKKSSKESSREEFTKELYAIMQANGKPILKVPSMGKAQVDLYELYALVLQYGGYSQVTMKRQWREIYDGLGRHSNDITNAATSVRKIYENLLLLYENKKRKKGEAVQENNVKNNLDNISKSENENSIAAENSSKCKGKNAECKLETSGDDKKKSTGNRPKSYKKRKEKRVLVNHYPVRCEYKRISDVEQCSNEPIPMAYVTCENNMLKQFPNGDILQAGCESSHIPCSQTPQNHLPKNQNEANTSFTLQAGEAFKLMIQKRRGRPSKDFRKQIEHLKTLNRKVEVKVFPPVGKRTRLPKWLNELNVDIVNPRKKRKYSVTSEDYVQSNGTRRYVRNKIEIPPLSKGEIPQVSHVSIANNSTEAGPSTSAVLKIDTPPTSRRRNLTNAFPEILTKSTNEYVSMVAISPEEKTLDCIEKCDRKKESEKDRCEFVIQSVQSLAKPSIKSTPSGNAKPYIHYRPIHPMTIPQPVLSFNEYRPKYDSSILIRNRPPPPRYPLSSSMSSRKPTSQTYRKADLLRGGDTTARPINVETKGPNLRSFGCKITGPNIRQICMQNNKKRIYTSDHRLSRADAKKDNVHMEKIYIHRPPYIPPHNTNIKTDHNPIPHIPITQNISLIPGHTEFSRKNLTFHNNDPSSNIYVSPTSTKHKNITGVTKDGGQLSISNPLLDNHQDVEPKPPKVYILPEEYPVVTPRTSV